MVVEVRRVCTSEHCNLFYKYERLLLDPFFDTPHVFQFTVVSLQLSSKSQRWHDPYLCRHLGAFCLIHTGVS